MTLSIAVFTWFFAAALDRGSNVDLPHFSRFTSCSFYEATDRTDIYYPDRCPRFWEAQGVICFPNGGYYSVNMQLSMKPGHEAEGVILMESTRPGPRWEMGPDARGNSQFLLAWKASDHFTLQGNAVILEAEPNECFRLKYSSTGKAEINTDPRASRLTIHKLR